MSGRLAAFTAGVSVGFLAAGVLVVVGAGRLRKALPL